MYCDCLQLILEERDAFNDDVDNSLKNQSNFSRSVLTTWRLTEAGRLGPNT